MVRGAGSCVKEVSQGRAGVMLGELSLTSLGLSTLHTMLLYITGRCDTNKPQSDVSLKESITVVAAGLFGYLVISIHFQVSFFLSLVGNVRH